jgi:membrane protein DedA with SNARE-associated domain
MAGGWIEPFIHSYGLFGLAVDIFLESMGAPLPGETLLAVAAGLAATGAFDIRMVALVAFAAAVLGDNLGYLIGRKFGRPVVLARGARFGITHERLDRVEAVLDHRGVLVVAVARFFPLLRQLNGLAAGTVGMHWLRFLAANAVGAAIWVGAWSWLAYGVGAHAGMLPALWHLLYRFAWVIVPGVILAMVGGWIFLRRRARK